MAKTHGGSRGSPWCHRSSGKRNGRGRPNVPSGELARGFCDRIHISVVVRRWCLTASPEQLHHAPGKPELPDSRSQVRDLSTTCQSQDGVQGVIIPSREKKKGNAQGGSGNKTEKKKVVPAKYQVGGKCEQMHAAHMISKARANKEKG